MKILTNIFVSLFYTGYIKIIPPGTFASFISILLIYPFIEFKLLDFKILIFLFLLIFLLSIYFIKKFSSYTSTHDSGIIVIDEFLGMFLIFIFYEKVFIVNTVTTLLAIFIVFRFFDIFKIFPANIIDKKMNNPLGVILDDIVASIYTIISLYCVNIYV